MGADSQEPSALTQDPLGCDFRHGLVSVMDLLATAVALGEWSGGDQARRARGCVFRAGERAGQKRQRYIQPVEDFSAAGFWRSRSAVVCFPAYSARPFELI
jgi:hypothetical protein